MRTLLALAATTALACAIPRGPAEPLSIPVSVSSQSRSSLDVYLLCGDRDVSAALVASGLLDCAAEPAVRDPDLLTAAELGGAAEASVYEAVRRLRPRFLLSRGPTSLKVPSAGGPAVWVDGTLIGGVESLRGLLPREVVTIRRLSAWDAGTTYGSRFTEGVIVVTTHPGP